MMKELHPYELSFLNAFNNFDYVYLHYIARMKESKLKEKQFIEQNPAFADIMRGLYYLVILSASVLYEEDIHDGFEPKEWKFLTKIRETVQLVCEMPDRDNPGIPYRDVYPFLSKLYKFKIEKYGLSIDLHWMEHYTKHINSLEKLYTLFQPI